MRAPAREHDLLAGDAERLGQAPAQLLRGDGDGVARDDGAPARERPEARAHVRRVVVVHRDGPGGDVELARGDLRDDGLDALAERRDAGAHDERPVVQAGDGRLLEGADRAELDARGQADADRLAVRAPALALGAEAVVAGLGEQPLEEGREVAGVVDDRR